MAKELFNQVLKTILGGTDRIALGIPGQEGCDNMLVSNFLALLETNNVSTGTIQNGDLTANVWELIHGEGTASVELTLYDGNGVKQSTDGIMSITDINTIEIDFGSAITGTWTYVFKWYNV